MRQAYPVVPDGDRVGLPVEANLEVGVLAELVEKQAQDGVRLRLRDADDPAREACTGAVSGLSGEMWR